MKNTNLLLLVLLICLVVFAYSNVNESDKSSGRSDLVKILTMIPEEAPVAYVCQTTDIIPDQKTMIIGTNVYLVGEKETKTAKVYIFVQKSQGWDLIYETDMDERISSQGLPASFLVSLDQVKITNVDEDIAKEIIIIWDTEPWAAFSLSQCETALHIIDYDEVHKSFSEVSKDKINYNTYNEKSLVLNIDCDLEKEIIVFKDIWEEGSCVTCAKRYRIYVWKLKEGEIELDPNWNNGRPLETTEKLSLREMYHKRVQCDYVKILSLLLSHTSTCNTQKKEVLVEKQ